ncbi:hypothetical protein [Klebsiella pneumoniae]|nr:hypothetical protein [Klebsiella pneumoniae]
MPLPAAPQEVKSES